MRYGVLLATLLVCCCVNHLRAAALEVQPGVQLKQQLESSSRESVQAIVPLHAAIGSSRTQLAARSFRRTRKLLTTAVRTQRRNLRQLFIGGPTTGGYTLYNAGSGTWWQTTAQPSQRQQDFTAFLQPATPEQGTAPADTEQQQQPQVSEQPIAEQPLEQQPEAEQQVTNADHGAPPAPAAHTAAGPAALTKSSAANDAEAEATAKSKDFDSWNTSPTCSYPKTAANVNLDKLGRPWGFDGATKQSCTFKDASAAAAGTISWDAAKDCPYQLTDSNALPDSHGRLWGYDGVAKQSCAFKSQTLPAGNSENGATSAGNVWLAQD